MSRRGFWAMFSFSKYHIKHANSISITSVQISIENRFLGHQVLRFSESTYHVE